MMRCRLPSSPVGECSDALATPLPGSTPVGGPRARWPPAAELQRSLLSPRAATRGRPILSGALTAPVRTRVARLRAMSTDTRPTPLSASLPKTMDGYDFDAETRRAKASLADIVVAGHSLNRATAKIRVESDPPEWD